MKLFIAEYNGIYEFIPFAYFVWSVLTMSSTMLVIQTVLVECLSEFISKSLCTDIAIISSFCFESLESQVMPTTLDIVWILCGFAEMFWSFAFIFFYCEFGEMVTNQFYEFDDQLYQCGWYLLSMELKQSYLAFLSYTEQPANIRCFGNLLCTREVFKKVKGVALYGRKFNQTTFYDIFFFLFRPPRTGSLIL